MKAFRSLVAGLFAAAALALPAAAETDPRFGVSLGASTLGVTVEPTYQFSDTFGLRMPIGGGDFDYDDTIRDYAYDGDISSRGVGLLADYRPFKGGLRLSGGVFWTDYTADLSGESVTFSGFTSDVDVNVRQKQNFMPALAVGYDGRIGKNATIGFTAGALFGDGFDVSGRASSPLVPQSLVDDELADFRDDASDIKVLPYLQLAVGWRF